jgi:hypothetical protein
MLLLYRVEIRSGTAVDGWYTVKTCRPKYKKTETFKIEKYGLFKLKKRRVVDQCTIHNEAAAVNDAFIAASQCIAKFSPKHDRIRLSATYRKNGELSTTVLSTTAGKD